MRHNTYTLCYVGLVADHHLLLVNHTPRLAYLIQTAILHNFPRGDGRVGGALSGGRGLYPHLTTRGVAGPSLLRGAFCGRGGG